MSQMTFSEAEYQNKKRKTRREIFLERMDKLLHGEERRVFGDAGNLGIQKRAEHTHRKAVSWLIAKRPGTRKKLDTDKLKAEKVKASTRA